MNFKVLIDTKLNSLHCMGYLILYNMHQIPPTIRNIKGIHCWGMNRVSITCLPVI